MKLQGVGGGITVDRMQAIFLSASEAIFGVDRDGRIHCANPAAGRLFGRSMDRMLGLPATGCVQGLDIAALHEMFEDSSSYYAGLDRITRRDLFGLRADGTHFPVEIGLSRNDLSESPHYVCIARDVTDERAAFEFTELYERALACSHNAVFISNARIAKHPLVYVNDAFQKILGLPLHHILGSAIEDLLQSSPTLTALAELRSAIGQARHASVNIQYKPANGSVRVLEVALSPVSSGSGVLTNFVGIVSDITARVEAEQAVAQRRAQLDAIFSVSVDGFVMFDALDTLVFANPALEKMLGIGLTGADPMSLAQFEQRLLSLCDESLAQPVMRGAVPDASWEEKLHLVRPQHRVVQARSRRNEAGRRETIIYFRDVTHEDAVDRMKSEFLASAAHELRTPMVSIFGFTELLLRRRYAEDRQADMLQTIHRQSGLLVKMINELLDLARIEARRGLDLRIDTHSLRELVSNSVKGLMRSETERQVSVGDVPDVPVLIDPEKMQLALANLLSNAFKYSPDGGNVTLQAFTDSRDNTGYAVITVTDQGIGMSPEQLARAFERFYRADTSGNIPGTGLGLCLVREIAELHKGKVELSSTRGQGTTATLWIPLATATIDTLAPQQDSFASLSFSTNERKTSCTDLSIAQ